MLELKVNRSGILIKQFCSFVQLTRIEIKIGNLMMVYQNTTTVPKVIIFDWDDTICPSSFFDRYKIDNIDELPSRVSSDDRLRLLVIFIKNKQ